MTDAHATPPAPRSSSTRVTLASLAGTTVEWYEFFIYGTAAALVFDKLFFPGDDEFVSVLLSLSTFALAFVARPIGGIIFGHFGDRLGRKSTLVVTLSLMGGATFCIGLLPTYGTIGIAAPILLVLLRLIQGLSLGGEYSGAVLMSVEHASKRRRGFFGSVVNTGSGWGSLIATVVFLVVSRLSDEAFLAWGWRIPFLVSVVLVGIGLVIRFKLAESPDFKHARDQGEVQRAPIYTVVTRYPGRVILICLAYLSGGITFYISMVYSLGYGEGQLELDRNTLLQLVLMGNVLTIVAMPFFGWLTDRVSRKLIFVAGIGGMIVLPYVWFSALDTKAYGLMAAGYILLLLPYAANYAAMPTFYAHVFPPAIRYTGMSLGYTLGTVLGSALAPLIAASLLNATGSWLAIAVYMSAAGVTSFVAALFLREQHQPTHAEMNAPVAQEPTR